MNNFLNNQIQNAKSVKDKISDNIKSIELGNKKNKIVQMLTLGAVCSFMAVVAICHNFTFAFAVSYENQDVGLVKAESSVEVATQMIKEQVVTENEDQKDNITINPKVSIVVAKKDDVITEEELADNIIETSSEVVKSEALYINGDLCAVVDEESDIDETLGNILDEYKTDDENVEIGFAEDIEIVQGVFLADEVVNQQDLEEKVKEENLVTVEKSFEENKYEEIPYDTEVIESENYLVGTQIVLESGNNGVIEYKEKVLTVNDDEKDRTLVEQTVLQEPSKQRIIIGTADPKENEDAILADVNGDEFILPIVGSYVSSPFGYREGQKHNGIDLCVKGGTMGKEVLSTASGVVEKILSTSQSGGYGLMVVVDHGNNVKSLYAHLNSINVELGQSVANGQLIGTAGNTGNSSGAHLHFELHIGDKIVNPVDYIKF